VDFVVAGLGLGALIVVLGFAIRDLGPLLWKRFSHGVFSDRDENRDRWRQLCHSVSNALTIAGCAVLTVTVAAVLLGASDRIGTISVAVSALAAAAAAIIAVGFTVRGYQSSSTQFPAGQIPSNQTTIAARELPKMSSPGPSAMRIQKPAMTPAKDAVDEKSDANLAAAARVAEEIESFDPTRLLPSEFDEHFVEATVESPVTLSPETHPSTDENDIDVEEIVAADGVAVVEDHVVSIEIAASPRSVFKSKLFADLGDREDKSAVNGNFKSSLLADVTEDAPAESGDFQSPLFANRTDEPEANSESIDEFSDDNASGAGETGSNGEPLTADESHSDAEDAATEPDPVDVEDELPAHKR
jgi:hypothetical protein